MSGAIIFDNSDPNQREMAARMALGMYIDEPCRLCAKPITAQDIHTAVFAGYSTDNTSWAAHGTCWVNFLILFEEYRKQLRSAEDTAV